MAGHSKFKNIMHRKGAQDAKRAKKFTRLIKELAVAARGGTDPESNPRLRTALSACRAANMPKDNIERVLKKAAGGDGDNYDEIRYEGYGPGGVALIVEALTDNRNRTASEVRATFSKYGGNMGETGSVSFMFDRVGQIMYPAEAADAAPDKKIAPEVENFVTTYYEFSGTFTTNLRNSTRFLQVGIGVSTQYDDTVMANVEMHQLSLRSEILGMMSEFSEEEIQGKAGRDALSAAIAEAINKKLIELEDFGGVESVHFTSFMLQ